MKRVFILAVCMMFLLTACGDATEDLQESIPQDLSAIHADMRVVTEQIESYSELGEEAYIRFMRSWNGEMWSDMYSTVLYGDFIEDAYGEEIVSPMSYCYLGQTMYKKTDLNWEEVSGELTVNDIVDLLSPASTVKKSDDGFSYTVPVDRLYNLCSLAWETHVLPDADAEVTVYVDNSGIVDTITVKWENSLITIVVRDWGSAVGYFPTPDVHEIVTVVPNPCAPCMVVYNYEVNGGVPYNVFTDAGFTGEVSEEGAVSLRNGDMVIDVPGATNLVQLEIRGVTSFGTSSFIECNMNGVCIGDDESAVQFLNWEHIANRYVYDDDFCSATISITDGKVAYFEYISK